MVSQGGGAGNAHAQWRLGDYLLTGMPAMGKDKASVGADPKQGIKWLTTAANQGHQMAQFKLGKCYEDGIGVKPDKIEAYKWYRLASQKDRIVAGTALDRLILKMSSEQIAEGQKRADSFVVGQPPSPEPRNLAILSELILKQLSACRELQIDLNFPCGDRRILALPPIEGVFCLCVINTFSVRQLARRATRSRIPISNSLKAPKQICQVQLS